MILVNLLLFFFSSWKLRISNNDLTISTQALTSWTCKRFQTIFSSQRSFNEEKYQERLPRVTDFDVKNNIYPYSAVDSNPPIPWRASFMVSKKTQSRIIDAGRSYVGSNNIDRAIQVLQTLLNDTSPYECNESNVVCALTLSAKILSQYQPSKAVNYAREKKKKSAIPPLNDNSTQLFKLQDLLLETISIAYQLILGNRLSARQLANVVWAIARANSNHDCLPILPIVEFDIVEVSEEYHTSDVESKDKRLRREPLISKSERVNLNSKDSLKEKQLIVAKTVDEICLRLCTILEKDHLLQKNIHEEMKNSTDRLDSKRRSTRETLNIIEVVMSVWSFAIFFPRERPPGWDLPPRVVKVTRDGNPLSATSLSATSSKNKTLSAQWITIEERNDLTKKDTNSVFTRNDLNANLIQAFFKGASDYVLRESMQGSLLNLKWQDLVNILWSFAYSGQGASSKSEGLITAIAEEVTHRLDHFHTLSHTLIPKSRDLAQIAWALGVLQCYNFSISSCLIQFIDALTKYLASNNPRRNLLNGWMSADVVQLAVSLAHGRIDKNELLVPLYEDIILSLNSHENSFSNGELTALLWTQARLYLVDDIFRAFSELAIRTLVQRVYQHSTDLPKRVGVHQLDSQEQANLAWSLVVLEQYSQTESVTLLKLIFESSSSLYSEGSFFHVEHAHQLWQAYSILRCECPKAVETVPIDFIDFLQKRWKKEKLRLKTSSDRHMALSKTLDLMLVPHLNEHDEDIDVAIILKSHSQWTKKSVILEDSCPTDDRDFHKVAIEFDGPNHFVRPQNGIKLLPKERPRPLGHTVLKYRLLKYQGWHVIRVPYYEYDKIPFWASMEKQRYLQRLLKTEAKRYFSNVDVSDYKAITPNRLSRFD